MGDSSIPTWTLRNLSLPAKLVLSVFMLSVGLGYLSALVQLHFQHAKDGKLFPDADDTVRIFHDSNYGKPPAARPVGKIEQLLTADRKLKLNGNGQMVAAFFKESEDWEDSIENLSKAKKIAPAEAKKIIEAEREGELQAVLAWVRSNGPKKAYDDDNYVLPAEWKKDQPITHAFIANSDGSSVKIKSILDMRCVQCHAENGQAKPRFDGYAFLTKTTYIPAASTTPTRQPGMSIDKLAQSTHVHLLGFSMLYGLTGLCFAFTGWPCLVRCLIAPLPLVAQVVDISCWWLARADAPWGVYFAKTIPITGGIVGLGLFLHIALVLWSLHNWSGKVVLALLVGAVVGAGVYFDVKGIVERTIEDEKPKPMEKKESDEPSKKKGADAKKGDREKGADGEARIDQSQPFTAWSKLDIFRHRGPCAVVCRVRLREGVSQGVRNDLSQPIP